MNKTFATLKNYIKPDDYLNSVKAFFVMQDTYKEFPDKVKNQPADDSTDQKRSQMFKHKNCI